MSARSKGFLLTVLREELNMHIEESDLGENVPLGSSGLDLESLGFTELAMHTGLKLGVHVPDEDIDKIAGFTVGQFTDYLDERLAAMDGA